MITKKEKKLWKLKSPKELKKKDKAETHGEAPHLEGFNTLANSPCPFAMRKIMTTLDQKRLMC
jgi:hypothetical protein